MLQKAIHTLRILLLTGIFFVCGWCLYLFQNQNEKSLFDLQQEYAEQIQKNLNNLLEPVVGAGNIQTMAQVQLQQINQTIVTKELSPTNQQITKTTHYQGPALKTQHISIVVNQNNQSIQNDLWNLVESAVGIDFNQGDTLSIRIIPFVQVPFWSFGIARITLIRIAGILSLVVILFVGLLIFLYQKANINSQVSSVHPNEKLWQKAIQIPIIRLSNALSGISAEVSAFILYRFPTELSQKITNLMPSEYVAQVMLHMEHLENLNYHAYKNLLTRSEMFLWHLTKNIISDSHQKSGEILDKLYQKEAIFDSIKQQNPQSAQQIHLSTLDLDDLADLSDTNFQILLQYIDKKTAILTLQIAPLRFHQKFAKNLPVDAWAELSDKCRQMPGTLMECQEARQKILDIAKNLIINKKVQF